MGALISNYMDIKLLESGLDSFSFEEKNDFMFQIANRKGKLITEITNDYMLQYHRDLKTQDFSNKCEEDIIKGFTASNGHSYPTARDDQFNMFATYVFTKDDPTVTTIMFKAQDVGEQIAHTKEEFQAVVLEGFKYVQGTLLKLDELRKQIRDCQSDAELVSIVW